MFYLKIFIYCIHVYVHQKGRRMHKNTHFETEKLRKKIISGPSYTGDTLSDIPPYILGATFILRPHSRLRHPWFFRQRLHENFFELERN